MQLLNSGTSDQTSPYSVGLVNFKKSKVLNQPNYIPEPTYVQVIFHVMHVILQLCIVSKFTCMVTVSSHRHFVGHCYKPLIKFRVSKVKFVYGTKRIIGVWQVFTLPYVVQ